jgi:hypothetical protein
MRTAPYKAREDRKEGRKFIACIATTAHQLWVKACEFDGIDPETYFAVFSDGNKFVPFYESAMAEFWQACREYDAGGYVGVRIV